MTAAQIAAEIANLSAQLVTALQDKGADIDYAEVLNRLSSAQNCTGTALDVIADTAADMDGNGWQTVSYEAARANHLSGSIGSGLAVAATSAHAEQNALVAA